MQRAVEKIRASFEDLLCDRKTVIKILSIILILLIALVFRIHGSLNEKTVSDFSETQNTSDEIWIDIGGAVSKPGVYKVKPETRLYEVIEMAGGLSSDADTDSINQAAYVEDGQKIIIPRHIINSDGDDENISSVQSTSDADLTGLVNINTADKKELMTLTGIGDVIADRIIEYRSANAFRSKEDIMSVKGIGASTFDKIKESITF